MPSHETSQQQPGRSQTGRFLEMIDVRALERVVSGREAGRQEAEIALTDPESCIAVLEERLRTAQRAVNERDRELALIRASLSWRLTAPIRFVCRGGADLFRTVNRLVIRPALVPALRKRLPTRLPASPLISCLCITRGRPDLLARSIRCFQAQRWAQRELLIVHEDDDPETRVYLSTLTDPMIRTMEVPASPKLTLGELRNLAVAAARGPLFCQWDDDDWYHVDRLSSQWEALRGARSTACVLNHWLVYDGSTGRAFISPRWQWEGSILCDKRALSSGLSYAAAGRAEDTPFVQALHADRRIAELLRPGLYIYVYHSRNVWDYGHWQNNILSKSVQELEADDAARIRDILDGRLSVAEGSVMLDTMLTRIGTAWAA